MRPRHTQNTGNYAGSGGSGPNSPGGKKFGGGCLNVKRFY